MTRRQFLKLCGVCATAASFTTVDYSESLWTRITGWWQRRQIRKKEAIIAKALASDEGRAALAQAMVEPIRRQLEYQAIGRKLLLVDELPHQYNSYVNKLTGKWMAAA
jgi:hypothetical protein